MGAACRDVGQDVVSFWDTVSGLKYGCKFLGLDFLMDHGLDRGMVYINILYCHGIRLVLFSFFFVNAALGGPR